MPPRKLPRVHGTMPMARECKCELCSPVRKAADKAFRDSQSEHRAMGIPLPDYIHGVNGYNNYKCRCEICTTANSASLYEAKERRAALPVPERVHGSENGYGNYKCRCEACTAAWTAGSTARAQRRAARKKAAV